MNTRDYLISESLKLFLRKSFKDVTLEEILKITGLSKGAFYYYFKSKEQLFLEIIDTYFSYMVLYDFESYSKSNLRQFYLDHIRDLEKAVSQFELEKDSLAGGEGPNINFFYPIFDALRLVPAFSEKFRLARQNEIRCWSEAVGRARKSGEISSTMSDEQIALIFIFTGNSIGLQLIMENCPVDKMPSAYLQFWDNFYASLKTNKMP